MRSYGTFTQYIDSVLEFIDTRLGETKIKNDEVLKALQLIIMDLSEQRTKKVKELEEIYDLCKALNAFFGSKFPTDRLDLVEESTSDKRK